MSDKSLGETFTDALAPLDAKLVQAVLLLQKILAELESQGKKK